MATPHTFTATIARVDEPVFAGQAISLIVPAADGMMEVLAQHTPLITNLTAGTVVVTDEAGEKHRYDIKGGTIEVAHNTVTVLI